MFELVQVETSSVCDCFQLDVLATQFYQGGEMKFKENKPAAQAAGADPPPLKLQQ